MNRMATGLTLALGLLLAAGCLQTTPSPADQAPESASAWEFEQILIGPGGDAETAVLVAPDGVVLACSHGGFGQPSPSWSSLDGGSTWTRMNPQPNPLVSGDCDFAVLDDGTWALVYDTIASATVAVSRDRGASWTFNYVAALPVGGVDRPWLAAQGNTLYLAYANVMAVEPALNFLAVSTDHGATWRHAVAHTVGPGDAQRPNTVIGHPLVAGDVVRIPLASANLQTGNGDTWLSFAVSRDGGASWTEEAVAGPFSSSFLLPQAGQRSDGTLYVTQVVRADPLSRIDVLVSRDDGATWSPIRVADNVSFPGVSGPWLDVRPDGLATVAWLHDEGGERSVWAARLGPDGVVQAARALTTPVADAAVFEFIAVDHDAAGRAYIVYPLDTGDCTQTTPLAAGRNAQCVWLLRETA